MRRTLFVVLGAIVVAAVACGFPDIEFASLADSGVASAIPESGLVKEGGAPDTGVGVGPGDDAGHIDLDANVPIDEGGTIVLNPAACKSCDCDGDGYLRTDDAGCDGGSRPDCDDLDGRTHPDAGFRYDDAEAPRFGDWNCDNTVTKAVPEHFACSDHAPLLSGTQLVTSCASFSGFVEPTVACGQSSTVQLCADPPLLGVVGNCKNGAVGTATQACQ
jgi:hypothetical protein